MFFANLQLSLFWPGCKSVLQNQLDEAEKLCDGPIQSGHNGGP